jgi:hypothetical protein
MTPPVGEAPVTPQQAKDRILEWGRRPWFEEGEVRAKLLSGTSPGVLLGLAAAAAAITCLAVGRPKGRAAIGGLLRPLLQPGVIAAVLPVLMDLWTAKSPKS